LSCTRKTAKIWRVQQVLTFVKIALLGHIRQKTGVLALRDAHDVIEENIPVSAQRTYPGHVRIAVLERMALLMA
jgi:hypothetical protein